MLGVTIACSGCIGLTHYTAVSHLGLEARLVDAGTRQPLTNTRVHVFVDGQNDNVRTDSAGSINVLPETEGHWTWLGGPIYRRWWKPGDAIVYEIEVPAYESVVGATTNLTTLSNAQDCLHLGMVCMKKRQAPAAASVAAGQ